MLVDRRVVRIEWADCDPAGVVYCPRCFAMLDAATRRLFEAAGWTKRDLLSEFDIVDYPIADVRARFVIPSGFGDDIVIESHVAAIRNSRFDVERKALKPAAGGGAAARFQRG